MSRHQCKNTNSQDTVSPLEPSNLAMADSGYCDITVVHKEKHLKVAFMNMIEDLRRGMNNSLKETHENTEETNKQTNTKAVQGLKVETESVGKTQTEETKSSGAQTRT